MVATAGTPSGWSQLAFQVQSPCGQTLEGARDIEKSSNGTLINKTNPSRCREYDIRRPLRRRQQGHIW